MGGDKMTTIINLVGGPGVGKSTVASGLFSALKQRKVSCEYVSEYAKEITWEGTHKLLENQIHVFSEQFRRQYRLLNKVSYVITDSPLILNSIYFNHYVEMLGNKEGFFTEDYIDLSIKFFDSSFEQFNNIVYLLDRSKEYDKNGRNQTLDEAKDLDFRILNKLVSCKVPHTTLFGNEEQNIKAILYDLGV